MQKTNSEKQKSFRRAGIAVALVAAAMAIGILPHARAEKYDQRRAYGLASGPAGIVAGQIAIIGVLNTGDEDALVRLQFMDSNGKVLIFCNAIAGAGKTIFETLKISDGTSNRVEFHAEVIANSKQEIKALVPSVQILENETSKTSLFVDRGGFAEFRGVPNPPLVPPDEPLLP
jgi:hypothetical protein